MNLFIIGNGFDLHHNLPTNYYQFAEYMQENFAEEYNWLYESIKKYFRTTSKNPQKIIRKYSDFFMKDNLRDVKSIYVLGHSLNDIDMRTLKLYKRV